MTNFSRTAWFVTGFAACSLFGCRIDPGTTDYESQRIEDFIDDSDTGDSATFLPGPDPYVEGESRVSFGPFYEGAASREIPVNDVTNFFFIFEADGSLSVEFSESSDRIEGFRSDMAAHAGTSFWGMSIAFYDGNPDSGGAPRPEDLSGLDTLHISFKSADAAFADVQVGVESDDGASTVNAADYGYANDGEWHTLEIPLADFDDVDLATVTTPLVLTGGGGSVGEELLIDNFYYAGP